MSIEVNTNYYSFPNHKYNVWLFGFSLTSLQSEYKFTETGYDQINAWMADLGSEELTQTRRAELQVSFKLLMASLVGLGRAVKSANTEKRISVRWWEDTVAPNW